MAAGQEPILPESLRTSSREQRHLCLPWVVPGDLAQGAEGLGVVVSGTQ